MNEEEIKEPPIAEHSGPTGDAGISLTIAVDTFEKERKRRPFSGRNPQLGKMIKCVLCGRRHRETECHLKAQKFANKPGTPEGETDPITVDAPGHRIANPYWRTHPGTMHFIPELKKFVRIVS